MGTLTAQGYVMESVSDLQNELQTEAQAQVPGFTGLPSELRTDLIQEATIVTAKIESQIADLLNGVAPAFANDFISQQFGASLGIPMNNATTSQVSVNFTGPAGTYIPLNTAVQSTDGTITVTAMTDGIIPVSGTVTLTCQTTQDVLILAGTMTVMAAPIAGVTVNNPVSGVQGVAAELIGAYRGRIQTALQSPRNGEVGLAYTLLNQVPGVNPLLIFFRPTQILKTVGMTATEFQGIEAVVGGGEDYAVALALFNSFLQTNNLISVPEVGSTVSETITVYNSSFPVQFTRPLASTLELDLTIMLSNASYDQTLMTQQLSAAFTSYLNSLIIGTPINEYEMNQIIINTMSANGLLPINFKSITYTTVKIDGSPVSLTNGFIPIRHDQYLPGSTLTLTVALS